MHKALHVNVNAISAIYCLACIHAIKMAAMASYHYNILHLVLQCTLDVKMKTFIISR